jgi:hypothetical protein
MVSALRRAGAIAAAAALVACSAPQRPSEPAAILSPALSLPRGGSVALVALGPGYPELRARFDADAARARLLVLASPT